MKLIIFGGGLFPWNMERGKGGGVLKFVEGPIGVVYGEALVKGGWAFLSTCLL